MDNFTLAGLKARFEQEAATTGKVILDQQVLAATKNLEFVGSLLDKQLALTNVRVTLDQTASPNRLTVIGNPETDWMINGVSGSVMTAVSVSLMYEAGGSRVSDSAMMFEGALKIDSQSILCSGSLAEGGNLAFVLKEAQAVKLPFEKVAALVASPLITATYLPAGVDIFTNIPITAIELTFGLSYTAPTRLRVTSDTGKPWTFIEGFDLKPLKNVGIRLFSTYTVHPNLKAITTYGGDIHADFALAGHDLEARLALDNTDVSEFALAPKSGGTLPGLVDLANALGIKESVQTALNMLGLGDISVQGVAIGFNLKAKELLYFSIVGRVRFVNVDFDLWMRLPNFQFGGGLARGATISFRSIAEHFFSTADNLPDVIVDEFSLAAQPSAGTYSLLVDLKEEGFTLGPVELKGLNLFIEKTQQGFDGSMSATLAIVETIIQVTVKRPSPGDGWQFEGGTTAPGNIPVSRFLSETIDMLFPSSPPSKSSVPPILDVDIKTFGIKFNTKTKDFSFDIDIEFHKEVETVLTFSSLHQAGTEPPTFEKRATGVIRIFPGQTNEFEFDLGIDLKPDSKHFVALYNNTAKKAINLVDLVKAMFPAANSLPEIPNFSITVKDAIVGYVSDKQNGNTVSQAVFALDMDASIDLTNLGNIPLIGESLSAAKTLKLAFQLVYPTLPLAKDDLAALNSLITVAGPRFPADEDLQRLLVKTELRIGDGDPIDFKLPVKVDNTVDKNNPVKLVSNGKTFDTPPGAQATDDGIKWFQLNKKFGPVHLQRAGFKFDSDKGELTALLDGGLTAFGLEVDLMGLSMTSKITEVSAGEFNPHFGLRGLGLSFTKGGVGFTGALLHLNVTRNGQSVDEYDGLATVEAEGLRLAAIGSLTTINKQTSLFLYAVLDYPLGGAPFFYVTGLAGGFGLNQKLTMPPPDQVSTFPLVQAALNPPAMPTDANAAGSFITEEMGRLQTYLTPSIGQYFGCAGIHFTSFELLDTLVVVSLSFGHEFELDLLGLSTLIVPPKLPESEPPLAKVSLQIVASFIPNEGVAIMQGRLTADSHIFDPNCHVSGGFAFATWFGSNPNAGDFVVTLGGYHPDFLKPDHYPTVPRVGINWQITPQLSVTGGLYFALTPRALMAGGAMRAVFQTSLDLDIATVDVKAWFILAADFIVYWKPFHYSTNLYIEIGIDVVIHFCGTYELGLDVGADLQIWGPPFGGHAHISFTVIGIRIDFDIDFGESAPAPLALHWDDPDASKSFRKSFLPADDQIVSVAIREGLDRKVEDGNSNWFVINPRDFCVHTSSVIPIKHCETDIPREQQKKKKKKSLSGFASNTNFGIASMNKGKKAVQTFHQIIVKRNGEAAESQFVARPIHSNVPGGLWAEKNSADINAERMIENAMVGFEIVPGNPPVSGDTKQIKRNLLNFTLHVVDNAYTEQTIKTFTATERSPGDDPVANRTNWNRIQAEIHVNKTRDKMLTALGFAKTELDIGEFFATDAAYAPSYGSLTR